LEGGKGEGRQLGGVSNTPTPYPKGEATWRGGGVRGEEGEATFPPLHNGILSPTLTLPFGEKGKVAFGFLVSNLEGCKGKGEGRGGNLEEG